jgi:hypothetical protein
MESFENVGDLTLKLSEGYGSAVLALEAVLNPQLRISMVQEDFGGFIILLT